MLTTKTLLPEYLAVISTELIKYSGVRILLTHVRRPIAPNQLKAISESGRTTKMAALELLDDESIRQLVIKNDLLITVLVDLESYHLLALKDKWVVGLLDRGVLSDTSFAKLTLFVINTLLDKWCQDKIDKHILRVTHILRLADVNALGFLNDPTIRGMIDAGTLTNEYLENICTADTVRKTALLLNKDNQADIQAGRKTVDDIVSPKAAPAGAAASFNPTYVMMFCPPVLAPGGALLQQGPPPKKEGLPIGNEAGFYERCVVQ